MRKNMISFREYFIYNYFSFKYLVWTLNILYNQFEELYIYLNQRDIIYIACLATFFNPAPGRA